MCKFVTKTFQESPAQSGHTASQAMHPLENLYEKDTKRKEMMKL